MMTTKGMSRRFRKALHRTGHEFPLSGPFTFSYNGKVVSQPDQLPTDDILKNATIVLHTGCIPGNLPIAPTEVITMPEPPPMLAETDRTLYKRTVREKNPDDPKSKRRVDYKPAKNPKSDDGVTYYAKINNKWQEVPATYANPAVAA